jgi:hypothetical protein
MKAGDLKKIPGDYKINLIIHHHRNSMMKVDDILNEIGCTFKRLSFFADGYSNWFADKSLRASLFSNHSNYQYGDLVSFDMPQNNNNDDFKIFNNVDSNTKCNTV